MSEPAKGQKAATEVKNTLIPPKKNAICAVISPGETYSVVPGSQTEF